MSGEKSIDNQIVDLISPVPNNEFERLLALNELELDYSDLNQSLGDLTKLAAKIAGTSISFINLIDTFTQWSVSSFGMEVSQTPREESVCQYTILEENSKGLEVPDLAADERFKDRDYVTGDPFLKYYFGVSLKIDEGLAIGSLCVMDDEYRSLSDEKKEMLEIVAEEIVTRIKTLHAISTLKKRLQESNTVKNNVAHDIRGPLGGIVGLTEIIELQGERNTLEEVLNYISLIQKSGKTVLELTDEILSRSSVVGKPKEHEFTLATLREKVIDLFGPQAMTKNVRFRVNHATEHASLPFSKNNILQILGNLISNSIKFTPAGGEVVVNLEMEVKDRFRQLLFKVKDSGVGMSKEKIDQIVNGNTASSSGTSGEKGYGFGLNLVLRLVTNLGGQISVSSEPGTGTQFELTLPVS